MPHMLFVKYLIEFNRFQISAQKRHERKMVMGYIYHEDITLGSTVIQSVTPSYPDPDPRST